MDKSKLVYALRAQIDEEIAEMRRYARDAAEAATHEEARAESDKDMRSTEASYLARGQAERVASLERSSALLATMQLAAFGPGDGIAVSAVVELAQGERRQYYFLVPPGVDGGRRVALGDLSIQTLGPSSPLGSALIGQTAGDDVEVPSRQGTRDFDILRVW